MQNQAGMLHLLLSQTTAPSCGIILEIKSDNIYKVPRTASMVKDVFIVMLKGTLPLSLTLKMRWREVSFGSVILVVWGYLVSRRLFVACEAVLQVFLVIFLFVLLAKGKGGRNSLLIMQIFFPFSMRNLTFWCSLNA